VGVTLQRIRKHSITVNGEDDDEKVQDRNCCKVFVAAAGLEEFVGIHHIVPTTSTRTKLTQHQKMPNPEDVI
jgi:hypothetical protein